VGRGAWRDPHPGRRGAGGGRLRRRQRPGRAGGGLLGGTLAATSFAAKATSRAAINTSPEPFSNIGASLLEDGLVPLGLWLAIAHPLVFVVLLAVVLASASG
jgi:hypothetical protein